MKKADWTSCSIGPCFRCLAKEDLLNLASVHKTDLSFAAGKPRALSDASFTFSGHRSLAITESLALACDGPTIRFIAPNRQEKFWDFLKSAMASVGNPTRKRGMNPPEGPASRSCLR
ncbi:MAG: hypothetical protein ACTHK7_05490, partial [Aureliella sp.]